MSDTADTALVTGASSGIGAALARRFAAGGHDLILVARREERLRELASELERDHRVTATAVVQDLATTDGPDRLYEAVRERGLRVDVLVNNVGIGTRGRFTDTDLDTERAELQLNVVAPTVLAKMFARDMLARGRGRVLNVSSSAAFQPGPFMAVYYASKAYALSLSEALAEELGAAGITVSALCPGPVETEFHGRAGTTGIPLTTWMQDPQTVADAGYTGLMNGQAVIVPGLEFKIATTGVGVLPRPLVRKAVRWINGGGLR